MEENLKQLLLKDLCARLPYGIICHTEKGDGHLCSINQTIFGTEYGLNISPIKRDRFNDSETEEQAVKPYLRPMSSMTEEENEELKYVIELGLQALEGEEGHNTVSAAPAAFEVDFYNKYHFDYRGLIEKGLALEAPDDMYK